MSTMNAIACTILVVSLLLILIISKYEVVGPTAVVGFLSGAAFATSIAVLANQHA